MRKATLGAILPFLFVAFLCFGKVFGGEIPDAPLEPSLDFHGQPDTHGSILEFWFLGANEHFTRMPVDPSVTGMIDDSPQVFYANSMQKDAEMKAYLRRGGLLQWTTYFSVRKPGKHVFTLSTTGTEKFPWVMNEFERSGLELVVNDEIKLKFRYNNSGSTTVDFAKPGLYKFQVRMWYSHNWRDLNWQDVRVSAKVKEPGSLTQRQMTAQDFLYSLPD